MANFNSDRKFVQKFVAPFYLESISSETFASNMNLLGDQINAELVNHLLNERNWRFRNVGAKFASVFNYNQFETDIGNLLLESKEVYCGAYYCITLAHFDTKSSREFLSRYLEKYLHMVELRYDQNYAYAALEYLSTKHDKNYYSPYVTGKQKYQESNICYKDFEQTVVWDMFASAKEGLNREMKTLSCLSNAGS